jgi:glycosyltransferase involved in cell wall biosynthesis
MSVRWHIVTPERPPDCGGVGDYTAQVAEGLAETGDGVSVYSPPACRPWTPPAGIEAVTLQDRFGRGSVRELAARLDRDPNSRLLVEYVPSVFGRRGTNVPFCRWLRSRRNAGGDVRVMFHEPYLYLRWRPDHIVTAFTQRAMAAILLDAATHVYLSTDTWRRYLVRFRADAVQRAVTLPIPSAIPCVKAAEDVEAARGALTGSATHVVGHFGSYGRHVAPLLRRALNDLLSSDLHVAAVCAGAESDSFVTRMIAERPILRGRLFATGRVSARDISVQLQACDLLLQPYPDGVTTRRTSVMAGLANGRAVVTVDGALTEHVWRATASVALVPSDDPAALVATARELLADPSGRTSLAARGSATYESCFALRHTIDALRAEGRVVSSA